MDINAIKKIISDNSSNIAFLIGNGINYHFNRSSSSWSDLLMDLWNKTLNSHKTQIPEGISLPEFYDVLEIRNFNEENFPRNLQKNIKDIMSRWTPAQEQNIILNKIERLNAPILTSNFDDLISRSMDLDFFRINTSKFTDFYPWSCYYANKELKAPAEGFGVWHINGMIKYTRSIKLGLSQYMGNVVRARKLLHGDSERKHFLEKNQEHWVGRYTWLHIIFNKPLFIFGLGLEENEVFLRWLLIERAKYFKKFSSRKHQGWYLTKKAENNKSDKGKRFFLDAVGFKVLEVSDYDIIYRQIWE